jgi:hypothetical protein
MRATSEARTRTSLGPDLDRWFATAPRRCSAARRAAAAWAARCWAARKSATPAVSIARLTARPPVCPPPIVVLDAAPDPESQRSNPTSEEHPSRNAQNPEPIACVRAPRDAAVRCTRRPVVGIRNCLIIRTLGMHSLLISDRARSRDKQWMAYIVLQPVQASSDAGLASLVHARESSG